MTGCRRAPSRPARSILCCRSADMLAALARHADGDGGRDAPLPAEAPRDWLPAIIELLRNKTSHDFTLYKPGTLQRQIERRRAPEARSVAAQDMHSYLQLLQTDQAELNVLARDLLINVTSFFRDESVFSLLADKVIPEAGARIRGT